MEQQSGANGWNTKMEAPSPRPGQMTLWTMQSIAHGADYISFFRWRTCTMGTEMYWHGILDYSSRENRRLREVKEIYSKIKAIEEIAGSKYIAAFGVLRDCDNIWDAGLDVWNKRVDEVSQKGIFKAAQLMHTPMDYLYLRDQTTAQELSQYPVLFYPHASIMTDKRKELLEEYVRKGGILVVGCRTGYKDITGKCIMKRLPGLLQNLKGTDVTEYSFIAPDEGKIHINWEGEAVEAAIFNDLLEPLGENSNPVGYYTDSYYQGEIGLIENSYGKGKVYYFGGAFCCETAKVFLKKLGLAHYFESYLEAPEECEVTMRAIENKKYLFILNYMKTSMQIKLKKPLTNMYSGKKEYGILEIEKYGTRIYKVD